MQGCPSQKSKIVSPSWAQCQLYFLSRNVHSVAVLPLWQPGKVEPMAGTLIQSPKWLKRNLLTSRTFSIRTIFIDPSDLKKRLRRKGNPKHHICWFYSTPHYILLKSIKSHSIPIQYPIRHHRLSPCSDLFQLAKKTILPSSVPILEAGYPFRSSWDKKRRKRQEKTEFFHRAHAPCFVVDIMFSFQRYYFSCCGFWLIFRG